MKNKYKICGDYTIIYMNNRKGETFETYIDTEDLEYLKQFNVSWHLKSNKTKKQKYVHACKYLGMINGKPKYQTLVLHAIIMRVSDYYKKHMIDHRDYNVLNNRKNNLRIVEISSNSKYRNGKNKNNSSGYRNVSWNKDMKKWVIQLQIEGKNKVFGYYEDVDEAGEIAKELREKYYGEFAGIG